MENSSSVRMIGAGGGVEVALARECLVALVLVIPEGTDALLVLLLVGLGFCFVDFVFILMGIRVVQG